MLGSRRHMKLLGTILSAALLLAACADGGEVAADGEEGSGEPDTTEDGEDEGPAPDVSTLRIATQDEGSGWHAYGVTMAEIIQENVAGVDRVQVLPVGGANANSQLVQDGDADLMINFNNTSRWAYEGMVDFEETTDEIRGLIGGIDEYYVGIVAREDLDADSFDDIINGEMGIRLFTLPPGSGGEAVVRVLLDQYGVSYDDIEDWGGSIENTTFDVIQSAFRDGRADVMIHTITADHPATTEISQTSDVKVLGIEDPEVLSAMGEQFGMPEGELPAESFRGQPSAVTTSGLVSNVATSVHLPDEVAYEITRALVEAWDQLVTAHPALAAMEPETAAEDELLGIPLHPGAEQYYEEAGLLPN